MNTRWKSARLDEVATVQSGSGFPERHQGRILDGIPFYKVSDMNIPGNERAMFHENNSVSDAVRRQLGASLFPAGSTIFPKIGGAIATNKKRITTRGCCVDNNVMGVIPDTEKLDPEFLFYYFLNHDLIEFANEAHLPSIKKSVVEASEIRYPESIPEQRRIVGILDEAFGGLAAATANAERNLQGARAVFETHLDAVFSNAGADWVDTTVGAHIEFIDYRGKTPVKTGAGLRLITAKNVRMGFLREEPMEFVATDAYDGWMTRGIPRKGDVLFTTEAPLGNVAQLDTDEKVVFAQRIIVMQPDPTRLVSGFLKYMLMSPPLQRRILEKGTGATATGIKASLLRLIPISFPKALDVQAEIADSFEELEDQVEQLESIYQRKLATLHELRISLLQQALGGAL